MKLRRDGNFLWKGDSAFASVRDKHFATADALLGSAELCRQLLTIPPEDRDGVRLLQIMAAGIVEKLNQSNQ